MLAYLLSVDVRHFRPEDYVQVVNDGGEEEKSMQFNPLNPTHVWIVKYHEQLTSTRGFPCSLARKCKPFVFETELEFYTDLAIYCERKQTRDRDERSYAYFLKKDYERVFRDCLCNR